MKVLKEGHLYELDSIEGKNIQKLQFIEKEAEEVIEEFGDGKGRTRVVFKTINDGTTNEEVLKVLIDRLTTLNKKLPSRENSIVLTKLEECLMWLDYRTKKRLEQKVENTPFPHKD